ncbi:hypothetical protein ACOMHN_005839 [Nucella lapillus]
MCLTHLNTKRLTGKNIDVLIRFSSFALCLQKLACALNERVVLPQHIQPYVFTNLSWDNIDRLEATVTGAGKRFQDAGLGDLCVESGILAGGSVAGVFEGKAYKRGVRVHKCVLEALLCMI